MSLPSNWKIFGAQSRHRRALLLEAVFWLIAVRLAILLIRFPRIAKRLGRLHHPSETVKSCAEAPDTIREISCAIDRAARIFPFRVVCLPRALASWRMLDRRGLICKVHFGASRSQDSDGLSTHAWVDVGGIEVTGYPEAYSCTEIGFYAEDSK